MYTCNISLSQGPYDAMPWRGGGGLKRGFGGPDRQVGLLRLGGVYLGTVVLLFYCAVCTNERGEKKIERTWRRCANKYMTRRGEEDVPGGRSLKAAGGVRKASRTCWYLEDVVGDAMC